MAKGITLYYCGTSQVIVVGTIRSVLIAEVSVSRLKVYGLWGLGYMFKALTKGSTKFLHTHVHVHAYMCVYIVYCMLGCKHG